MIGPPTNSAAANCQPISTTSTMPSSSTRLVDANMNTIADTKSAPFWNSDLAIADAGVRAARRHHSEARRRGRPPPAGGRRARAASGPSTTNACTAPDNVKPRISAHSVSQNMKNASRRLVADVAQRRRTRSGAPSRARHVHERTSRATAADASAILSCAVAPPLPIASATHVVQMAVEQLRARPLAAPWSPPTTCVSTSMQYASSSTMRCRPRTWPSIRRSRRCTSSFSIAVTRHSSSRPMLYPPRVSEPSGRSLRTSAAANREDGRVTYSVVARDPETGAFGVAVQSHFFSIGAVVPWVEAGVGAVATQAFGELELRAARARADARRRFVVRHCARARSLAADAGRETRQVAMIDRLGSRRRPHRSSVRRPRRRTHRPRAGRSRRT